MSRIDQISGIVSGAVEVCVAVIDQTVKSLAITAYSRVTVRTLIRQGFQRALNRILCRGHLFGLQRTVDSAEMNSRCPFKDCVTPQWTTEHMRSKRFEVSEKRRQEFEQRPGEDPYQWIARQIDSATPFEATWLFYLRSGDQNQREAWKFHQAAVTAMWTRRAVFVSSVGLALAVVLSAASMVVDKF